MGRKEECAKLRVARFDFEFGTALFDNPVAEKVDDRRDCGELRIVAIGMIGDDYFTVVYTPRGEKRRIISVRRAKRKEINEYHSKNPG